MKLENDMKRVYTVTLLLCLSVLLSACSDTVLDDEAYNPPQKVKNPAPVGTVAQEYPPFENYSATQGVGIGASSNAPVAQNDDIYNEQGAIVGSTPPSTATATAEPGFISGSTASAAAAVPAHHTVVKKPKSRPREEPGVWSGAPPSTTAQAGG
jgi:hypothetical protein